MIARDISEITLEATQLLVAEVTNSDLLKDIPIVGWLLKSVDVYNNLQDRLFIRKLGIFIYSLNQLNDKDKNEILERIKRNDEIDAVAEKILHVINASTDTEKSEMIANIFLAYIYERIDLSDFRRCINIIDKVFLDDLHNFIRINSNDEYVSTRFTPEELAFNKIHDLIKSPLLDRMQGTMAIQELLMKGKSDTEHEWIAYEITPIGMLFIQSNQYGKNLRTKDKS